MDCSCYWAAFWTGVATPFIIALVFAGLAWATCSPPKRNTPQRPEPEEWR